MKIRYAGRLHDVRLLDDGTLDTVLSVDGRTMRYVFDECPPHRDRTGAVSRRGLRELAVDAIDNGLFEEEEKEENR